MKKQYENEREHQRIVKLCMLFFVCFLLIYAVFYSFLYKKVNVTPDHVISQGIYIGTTDVSGLTAKQAKVEIDKNIKKQRKSNVKMTSDSQSSSAALEELGFKIKDEKKLINEAVEYGKKGNVWKRYFQLRKLDKEGKVFDMPYTLNKKKASNIITERIGNMIDQPVDATIRREEGKFKITEGKDGIVVDTDATIQKIEKKLNNQWNGEDITVEAVCKKGKPKITKKDLEEIKDNLGSYETYCEGNQNRISNIKNGVDHISGTVVMPGEEFSAGNAMKPLTIENGYLEAGAFENGELVQSVAGGICQVSTTLYNAVIRAELEVTERHPHSMAVSYVKASMDAAIAGSHKDFKFKNTSDAPILIEGYVNGRTLVFNVYGKETRDKNRKVDFVSETISTTDATTSYVASSDPIGTMSRKGGSHKGMSARLWKVVYVDDKEVSREVFNTSNYQASKRVVTVGTGSSNPEASAIVRNAVGSQNEQTIKAAIAQAKAKGSQPVQEKPKEQAPQQEVPQQEAPQPETPQPEAPQTPQPEIPEVETPEQEP